MNRMRCSWCLSDPLYVKYHDEEWGTPIHDDQKLFEFLILEGMQAGLSWLIILKRREGFRAAFKGFDPLKVARMTEEELHEICARPDVIKNRVKIFAAASNARAFLKVQGEFGSFDRYIWDFIGGKPIQNQWSTSQEVPCRYPIADKMAKELKSRGFFFVGPKICTSFMQATGMINDHLISCFRHKELLLL